MSEPGPPSIERTDGDPSACCRSEAPVSSTAAMPVNVGASLDGEELEPGVVASLRPLQENAAGTSRKLPASSRAPSRVSTWRRRFDRQHRRDGDKPPALLRCDLGSLIENGFRLTTGFFVGHGSDLRLRSFSRKWPLWEFNIHHEPLKVGERAERVKVWIALHPHHVAVTSGNRPSEPDHRLVKFDAPLPCRKAGSGRAGDRSQAGVATGQKIERLVGDPLMLFGTGDRGASSLLHRPAGRFSVA